MSFDVCVAGAGVAGITLALKLSEAGRSVLLLEGGGNEITWDSQELYQGDVVGMEYLDLRTCRLRYLGGSSNHWTGMCRPLDPHDFEPKDYIPYSGWPISKADIEPYEGETYRILDIPEPPGPNSEFIESDGMLEWFEMSFSAPTRFREKYGADLETSGNIHLVLNANVVDYRLDGSGERVEAVVCRSHADVVRDHVFEADVFVLAMGGIENARMLLNADKQMPGGLGNQNDLVGRFFADHPHFPLGVFWENDPVRPWRYISPTTNLMHRERIANFGLRLLGYGSWPVDSIDMQAAENLVKNLACSFELVRDLLDTMDVKVRCEEFGRLMGVWEQVPNPNSRIFLSDSRDKFGLRTTLVDWQWTPLDRRTARVSALEVGKAFARGDLGRVRIDEWVLDESLSPPEGGERAGRHHLGTTRMADTPETGVVDENCRVFDLGNFYIAGSSVFSTAGHANPTFTIVQLTLRLADHIKGLEV